MLATSAHAHPAYKVSTWQNFDSFIGAPNAAVHFQNGQASVSRVARGTHLLKTLKAPKNRLSLLQQVLHLCRLVKQHQLAMSIPTKAILYPPALASSIAFSVVV
jgi:hypothetical protein